MLDDDTTDLSGEDGWLHPLIEHIRQYDSKRLALEEHGGHVIDLRHLAEHLRKPINLRRRFSSREVTLIDPAGIQHALSDFSNYRLRLVVRVLETKLPVYYLCRIYSDYWSDQVMILEDYYMSPGYPLVDDRFVKLMRYGHETQHLRLSGLRSATRQTITRGKNSEEDVDATLRKIGEHIFRSAWHDDQRTAWSAAAVFGLRQFRDAVELLYLSLGADLCDLRSRVDTDALAFFKDVYPQPAIRGLLVRLPRLDGRAINELPQTALGLYAKLSQSFRSLLHAIVPWGSPPVKTALYRLLFANLPRTAALGNALRDVDEIRKAAARLEREAETAIRRVVGDGEC